LLLAPRLAFAQDEGAAAALAWLRGAQLADGTWAGDPRLALRDTAEVLRAFDVLAPDDEAVRDAEDVLAARADVTVDLEARRLEALSSRLPAVVLEQPISDLLAARVPDGGWAIASSFAVSDALDTSLALRGLLAAGPVSAEVIVSALSRLEVLQSPDGGFAHAAGEPSDLMTTAEVLHTIALLGELTDVSAVIGEAVAFLMAVQSPDGGFPSLPGGAGDEATTSLVLRALDLSGAEIAAEHVVAQDFLRAVQLPDGSFAEDPYATALAAQVLGGARPDLSVESVSLSSAVVDQGAVVTVMVRVQNRGVAAAPQSSIDLFHGDPNAGGVRLAATVLPGLAAGVQNEVAIALETSGLSGSIRLVAVADAADLLAERSELNNRRTVVLQVVPPGGAVEPNRAPRITSAPVRSATPGGGYRYDVEATDADGDTFAFSLGRAPVGMTIDGATGLVEWMAPFDPMLADVLVLVRDVPGASAGQAFTVVVGSPDENLPPVFESLPSSAATLSFAYTYSIVARDPEGAAVTLRLLAGPAAMSLDGAMLTWTPLPEDAGDHVVRIQAADDRGASVEQQWIVVVDPADRGVDLVAVEVDPSAAPSDPQSLVIGGSVGVDVANQGDASSPETTVVCFEDRDGSETYGAGIDLDLGSATVPPLEPGAAVSLAVAVAGTVLFRDNRVFAIVDPGQVIGEQRTANNVYVSGRERRFVPAPGPLRAEVELEWNGAGPDDAKKQVITSPMVAQLTDDDGDGRVGPGDVPDIVFVASDSVGLTIQSAAGYLRAIDGRTGELVLDVAAPGVVLEGSSTPAVADLDSDGRPEIVVPGADGIYAFGADGTRLWKGELPARFPGNGGAVSFADLDADGVPEVVFGNAVLGADGTLRCQGQGGSGTFSSIGPLSVVADLDGDGVPEIVGGNTAYRADCSVLWTRGDLSDGYTAIGQFDSDPEPEIVLVNGRVTLLEHTGETKWVATPEGLDRGGPPAVGDLDGDGEAEVAVAGFSMLHVLETDGLIRWSAATTDLSSGITGPTLADLDGDGEVELSYADEMAFRIYRGSTGEVLFSAENRSGTLVESPTVADVDGDGLLEVAIATNQVFFAPPFDWPIAGIRVFGHDGWAPGRALWNQESYHFTNVRCDQTIPDHERASWQVFGSYRMAHPVPEDRALREELRCAVGTADLTASFLQIDRAACPAAVDYAVRIGNGGESTVAVGAEVRFRHAPPGSDLVEVGAIATSRSLSPGEYEDVRVTAPVGEGLHTVVTEADPDAAVADGRRENNVHQLDAFPCEKNRPPAFTSAPSLVATAGQVYSYPPSALDPDADPLAFVLTTSPAGMSVAGALGPVLWVPSAEQVGEHLVALEVRDGRGGADVQEWVIDIEPSRLEAPPDPPVDGIAMELRTDRLQYGADEEVLLSGTVTNLLGAGRAGTAQIDVLIQDAQGPIVGVALAPTPLLFQHAETLGVEASFGTGRLAAGQYVARASYREGDAVSTADAAFEVVAGGIGPRCSGSPGPAAAAVCPTASNPTGTRPGPSPPSPPTEQNALRRPGPHAQSAPPATAKACLNRLRARAFNALPRTSTATLSRAGALKP
jgi:hypothetical protein